MAETVGSILDEVSAGVTAMVGETGRFEIPINQPDTLLEEVTLSHSGFVVPGWSRGDYDNAVFRNELRADTRRRHPDKVTEDDEDEAIPSRYSPGLTVVRHCVAAPGQPDRRSKTSSPIQFNWLGLEVLLRRSG